MTDKESSREPSEGLKNLHSKLEKLGIPSEIEIDNAFGALLRADFPNGRAKRKVHIWDDDDDITLWEEIDPSKINFLGDYMAFVRTDTGVIEARIDRSGRALPYSQPWRLPGVEILNEEDAPDGEDSEDSAAPAWSRRPPKNWRLLVQGTKAELEVSPRSQEARALLPGPSSAFSLKIRGVETTSEDEAVATLSSLGEAFLFDLDVCYGTSFSLAYARRRFSYATNSKQSHATVGFPKNAYANEALSLYRYGREAAGLPLLEFLAYYQSLEFFFPTFSSEQALKSLRNELRRPDFDRENDVTLTRLVALASQASRTGVSEREQLRATLRGCITQEAIQTFIESHEAFVDHFYSKRQAISGVQPLKLQGDQDLRDQLADRIYAIRCRVVHTKGDGGPPGVDLLLPSSREARSLTPDVELLREVARAALIARATPARCDGPPDVRRNCAT